MKLFFNTLLILLSFYVSGYAQKPYKIVFYNLENFFDLENDPDVLDDEFTPKARNDGLRTNITRNSVTLKRCFLTLLPSIKIIQP